MKQKGGVFKSKIGKITVAGIVILLILVSVSIIIAIKNQSNKNSGNINNNYKKAFKTKMDEEKISKSKKDKNNKKNTYKVEEKSKNIEQKKSAKEITNSYALESKNNQEKNLNVNPKKAPEPKQKKAPEPKPKKAPEPKPVYLLSSNLNVPYINQYAAGAPMGCEAASLLQCLHYKGYATNYNLESFLAEMPISPDNNPYNGFAGTPYKVLSDDIFQSIFPAPLTDWGKQYGNVCNISGASVETLKQELLNNNPVVIYVPIYFQKAKWKDYFHGTTLFNMHVITLSGYDEKTGNYKVTDPIRGNVWIKKGIFERGYNYLKWAVVVR